MRIAMVNNSRGWGGAEEIMLLLATRLQERGHHAGVFLREGSSTVAKFKSAGLPVWPIRRDGIGVLGGIVRMLRIARQERFDLVHTHRNHDLAVGKLAALATGAPLLLTQHCQVGNTSSVIMNLADRLTCVSGFIADGITDRFPHLGPKVGVVHNGIDLHAFEGARRDYWSEKKELAGKGPFVGVTGYFYKNQEELVELVPRLKKIFPGVVLVIIGHDHSKGEWLKQRVEDVGVADSVYFAGYLPYDVMKHALASLDLQLSAFRREGFGLSVIEGMAVGTPFVGYRAGGYREIVIDGENGFLVESADEMVVVATELLQAPERLKVMRHNARLTAERFSLGPMLDSYESLYQEMVR